MKRKNFRKVPDFIREKLKTLPKTDIVVACSKRLEHSDIARERWKHLALSFENGRVVAPVEVLPEADQGRYSERNLTGHMVVRKDLAKISKDFTFEVPNFGDWSKGSHDITISRLVYPQEFYAPHELTIGITSLRTEDEATIFKFAVNEVLNTKAENFEARLLFNLNLLLENVGSVGVFESAASTADYLTTIHVDWEILPQGSREAVLARLLAGARKNTELIGVKFEQRRRLLEAFRPQAWIVGNSGFRRYFGAKFRDDLVVFENIEYGNAVYALFDKWDDLSKLSRIELMERTDGLVRIVHRTGWEAKLKKLLEEKIGPLDERQAA